MIGFHNVVEGGLLLILPAFLEGGEIMFDRVQIWRIRREEQQGRACLLDEPRRFRRGMKRGVVHNHEVLSIQTRAQPRLEPGIEDRRIAGPIEQV